MIEERRSRRTMGVFLGVSGFLHAVFVFCVPVGPQKVRLMLPGGTKARAVRFLVSQAKAQWRQTGAWIETTTPPVGLHEAVAVDL